MSAPTRTTETNEETREEQQPTFQEQMEKEEEQKAHVFNLVGVALAFGGVSSGVSIRRKSNDLHHLDADRFMKDAVYRQDIQDAINFRKGVRRFLRRKNPSQVIEKGERAFAKYADAKEEEGRVINTFAKQYRIDLLQTYGFNEEQIKNIQERAVKFAKEQGISLRDAIRIEGRKTMLRTEATRQVEVEIKAREEKAKLENKKVPITYDQEKEVLIQDRIQKLNASGFGNDKEKKYLDTTETLKDTELEYRKKALDKGKESIAWEHPKPKVATIPTKTPRLRQFFSDTRKAVAQRWNGYVQRERARIRLRVQRIRAFIANTRIGKAISQARTAFIQAFARERLRIALRFARARAILSRSPVGHIFRGFQNFLGGQIGRIRNRLNAINAFKGKAVDLALNALSTAFPPGKALKFAIDGLDKLAQFLGMGSVKGKIFDVTVMIGVILIGAILLPFLLLMTSSSSQPFASITADNPQVITARGEFKRVYSWKEFSTEFLAEQKNVKNEIFNNWMYFSKTFLSETQKISVLNPNRHDDVKE